MLVSEGCEMNPTKRNTMEDVHRDVCPFTSSPPFSYLAVYDGHGGRGLVDFIELRFEQNVAAEIKNGMSQPSDENDDGKSGTSMVLRALERAYLITDMQSRQAGIMTSGATAVTCLIGDKKLYAANCGDARAVLGRGGKAIRLTRDHKADDDDEVKRIEDAGGFIMRNRVLGILAVARSLGDHGMKEFVIGKPFLSETDLEDCDEFVVVACDGLWDVISDQETVDLVREWTKGMTDDEKKEKIADMLIQEALKRGSTDNISVIVGWL